MGGSIPRLFNLRAEMRKSENAGTRAALRHSKSTEVRMARHEDLLGGSINDHVSATRAKATIDRHHDNITPRRTTLASASPNLPPPPSHLSSLPHALDETQFSARNRGYALQDYKIWTCRSPVSVVLGRATDLRPLPGCLGVEADRWLGNTRSLGSAPRVQGVIPS